MGEFRCFNKNKIKIQAVIQIDITLGTSSSRNCEILVVPHNTVNLLGRDLFQKLGKQLAQTEKGEEKFNSNQNKSQQIAQKIFKKYPHLCNRMGRSKNHISKSIFKQYFKPTQHKGRRVPLHLVDKVEKELKKN